MIGQPHSFPPFLSLFIPRSLHIVNKLSNRYVFAFQKPQWFIPGSETHLQSLQRKTHIYQLAVLRRGKDKLRAGYAHKHTEHPSLLQPVSGNFSDEIFVSGGASCGYCSTISPPSDVLLLLYTALISPRLTSRHAREPPADSSVCVLKLHE